MTDPITNALRRNSRLRELIDDLDVIELKLTPDGSIHARRQGDRRAQQLIVERETLAQLFQAIDDVHNNAQRPVVVEAGAFRWIKLDDHLSRGEALFGLRVRPERVTTSELVREGFITRQGIRLIEGALRSERGVVIAGPPRSGKTRLLTSLLSRLRASDGHVIVLEGHIELDLEGLDVTSLRRSTLPTAPPHRQVFADLVQRADILVADQLTPQDDWSWIAPRHPTQERPQSLLLALRADSAEGALAQLIDMAASDDGEARLSDAGLDLLVLCGHDEGGQPIVQGLLHIPDGPLRRELPVSLRSALDPAPERDPSPAPTRRATEERAEEDPPLADATDAPASPHRDHLNASTDNTEPPPSQALTPETPEATPTTRARDEATPAPPQRPSPEEEAPAAAAQDAEREALAEAEALPSADDAQEEPAATAAAEATPDETPSPPRKTPSYENASHESASDEVAQVEATDDKAEALTAPPALPKAPLGPSQDVIGRLQRRLQQTERLEVDKLQSPLQSTALMSVDQLRAGSAAVSGGDSAQDPPDDAQKDSAQDLPDDAQKTRGRSRRAPTRPMEVFTPKEPGASPIREVADGEPPPPEESQEQEAASQDQDTSSSRLSSLRLTAIRPGRRRLSGTLERKKPDEPEPEPADTAPPSPRASRSNSRAFSRVLERPSRSRDAAEAPETPSPEEAPPPDEEDQEKQDNRANAWAMRRKVYTGNEDPPPARIPTGQVRLPADEDATTIMRDSRKLAAAGLTARDDDVEDLDDELDDLFLEEDDSTDVALDADSTTEMTRDMMNRALPRYQELGDYDKTLPRGPRRKK